MRLVLAQDTDTVWVTCARCGRMRPLSHMVADLDGPAFRAYFCQQTCQPADATEADRLYARLQELS
jgi:hypothetical protein